METKKPYDMFLGKNIIFIDDRYEITLPYIKKVQQYGAIIEYTNFISQACDILTNRQFDFAILDLHMQLPNPLPPQLEEFGNIFYMDLKEPLGEKRSLNAGQIIGMYINIKLERRVKFIYLSAVGAHYEKLKNGEPSGENKCFDKYKTSPIDIANTILKLMK